jgi:hypothetical protein
MHVSAIRASLEHRAFFYYTLIILSSLGKSERSSKIFIAHARSVMSIYCRFVGVAFQAFLDISLWTESCAVYSSCLSLKFLVFLVL